MTDAQRRLLREIAARVDANRIAEVHLFPAIRQGGVETGIAVVAVDETPEPAACDDPTESAAGDAPAALSDAPADDEPAPDALALDAGRELPPIDAPDVLDAEGDAVRIVEPEPADSPAEGWDGPLAPGVELAGSDGEPAGHDEAPDETATAAAPLPPAARTRHVVYSARYRLTLKGPDRGKWEADVVPEADAPLATVDVVVRGVQRRAGEEMAPERLSGEAFRRALEPAAEWATTTA